MSLILVLYAGKDHFRSRDNRPRIGQVGVESLRIPGMVEFFHCFRVIEIFHARGFAANNAEQAWPDLVLPRFGGVAERAFFEFCLAGIDIGSRSGAYRICQLSTTRAGAQLGCENHDQKIALMTCILVVLPPLENEIAAKDLQLQP